MPASDDHNWRQYGKTVNFTPQSVTPKPQKAALMIDGVWEECLVMSYKNEGNGWQRIEVVTYPSLEVVKPPRSRIDRLLADEELV